CRHHHRLVHEEGYTIERRDDGRLLFFTPTGVLIPHAPAATAAQAPVDAVNAARGVDVSAGTAVPRWTGDRMNLGMVIDGLLQADARWRGAPGDIRYDESKRHSV
ncbi:MAG: hypothetical protein WD448_06505, partial [Woeseia sp.]